MAQSKILDQNKSLECSICFSDFVEPKQLSCLHNFCLKCLREYCSDCKTGDKKPCPLCRAEFSIPQGGVKELPNNEFLMRIGLTKGGSKEHEKPSVCEICAGLGDDVEAESFCMECKQCLCTRCKKCHLLQTVTSNHNLVKTDKKPSEEKLRKMHSSYCLKHAGEETKIYCCDCCEVLCYVCHFNDHGKHVCKLLAEVVQEKKDWVLNGGMSIEKCLKEGHYKLRRLQQEYEKTLQEASNAEQCIEETFSNVILAITNYKTEVLNSLAEINASRLKEIESQKDLDEFYNTELSSLLTYSRMLVERGTDCEIMKAAENIMKRTDELIKSHDERIKQTLPDCCITFQPSTVASKEEMEKFVGRILDKDTTICTAKAQLNKAIKDFALVDDQMFVVQPGQSYVNVYDSLTLTAKPPINIPGMKDPRGLAGCSHNKALYISDYDLQCIHKLNLIDKTLKRWKLRKIYYPLRLSLISKHNLLITADIIEFSKYRGSVTMEYTGEGQLLQEIKLDKIFHSAWLTVQFSADQLLCAGTQTTTYKSCLCFINASGQLINSYGREGGAGDGQLSMPSSLTVDPATNLIFVADKYNDRVLMLSKDLVLLGQVQSPEKLIEPICVSYDYRTCKLIVGEESGRVLMFGLI